MGVHLYTNGAWTDSGRIYRESKNLYDILTTSGYTSNIMDWTQTIDNDTIYVYGSNIAGVARGLTMILGTYPAGTYTFNINSSYPLTTLYLRKYGETNQSATITIDTESILEISLVIGKRDYIFNDFMLNSGSIALPYEPYNVIDWYTNTGHGYSSGAWD